MSMTEQEAIVPSLSDASSLIARWRAVVARHAADVALVCGARTVTYGELEREARVAAAALVARGVAPTQRVAICASSPSVESVAVMLGALYAGASCVGLEPRWSTQRLRELVAAVGPALVVYEPSQAVVVEQVASDGRWPACELAALSLPSAAVELPPLALSRVHPAYLMPSAGAGAARAAVLGHGDVLHGLAAWESALEPAAGDVWSQLHSQAFYLSLWEVWGALAFGGRLALPEPGELSAPAGLLSFAVRHQVAMLALTPWELFGLLEQLARAPGPERARLRPAFLLLTGEALPASLARRWFELAGEDTVVVHAYGTAETGGPVVLGALTPADVARDQPAPLGGPVADVSWQLVDERQRPVPRGAVGELVLESEALSFETLAGPAGTRGAARRFASGDLARQTADGRLVVVDRVGDSVMARGVRVSPAEVEAALRGCGGVAAAVVLGRTSDAGGELDAYLLPRDELDADVLRRELRDRVPGFLHPHTLRVVREIPLDVAGRIDRAALRGCGVALESRRPSAALTDDEARMLEVWRQALQVPELGVEDDFFSAGGTSIRAVELVIALRGAGFSAAVRDVLQAPTVRELVARLGGGATAAPAPVDDGALAGEVSDLQHVMLDQYARHAATGNGVYHVQESFTLIDRALDASRLAGCFAAEVAREPAFRTYFERAEAGYRRRAADAPQVELAYVDLRRLTPDEQEARLAAYAAADLARPFALVGLGARSRFTVFELSATSARVFSSAHHATADGWSQQQFLRWVVAAYRGQPPPPAPPAADPYDALVAAQARAARDPEVGARWRQLELAPGSLVAADRPAPARYLEVSRQLSRDSVLRLLELAQGARVQAKALFLAAAAQGLAELTEVDAVTLGVVVNGRLPEVPGMLEARGLYWNLQPLTVAAGAAGAVSALHDELSRLERFALAPLTGLLRARAPGQDLRYTFNYTSFPPVGVDEVETRDWRARDTWHYPLNLGVHLDLEAHEHEARVTCDPAECSQPDATRLLATIAGVLERWLVAAPADLAARAAQRQGGDR